MDKYVISTISWARNEQEGNFLLECLRQLAKHRLPIVVTDGGSIGSFCERVGEIPGITLLPTVPYSGARLLSQVKATLAGASTLGADKVLYTEPDKQEFFERQLADFLEFGLREAEAGMILASRDAGSFETFPQGQQLTETLMDRLGAETLGVRGDLCYGPLILRRELCSALETVEEDIGWGWRFFMMAVSHRLGLPIQLYEADLPCPETQRGEDDLKSRLYRMEQLAQNVKGLALGLKHALSSAP